MAESWTSPVNTYLPRHERVSAVTLGHRRDKGDQERADSVKMRAGKIAGELSPLEAPYMPAETGGFGYDHGGGNAMYSSRMAPPSDKSIMRRVLLVEDDDVLRANYEALLTAHRLQVRACATKVEALEAFEHEDFDVILLDVTLGGEDEAGFDLCRVFRERRKLLPIIFLTERDQDPDRISGLRLGADDYLARINALIRRVETLTAGATEVATVAAKKSESRLRIDDRLSQAYWLGFPLELSLTQFWILKDLFEHAGTVRSITDLMRAANITVQPNTIVVHIKAIREAIQRHTDNFSCIKSERARGYRWVDDLPS
jgi:two-component system, OmpR family, response regulator